MNKTTRSYQLDYIPEGGYTAITCPACKGRAYPAPDGDQYWCMACDKLYRIDYSKIALLELADGLLA